MKCTITLIRKDRKGQTIGGLCIEDACFILKLPGNEWEVARIDNGLSPTPWK